MSTEDEIEKREWMRLMYGIGEDRTIPVRNPASEPAVAPLCAGDHYFENRCNACGAAQPDGPCEVCPHIGSAESCRSEHFLRRPCRSCGSPDLRTVRVREASR